MNQALAFPINGTGETSAWVPKKFRYWYDGIIDLLLVDPTLSQKDIAAKMGRHAVTIGMVMNCDMFRARYEQRRGSQSKALQEKINDRISGVAIKALELVEAKLDTRGSTASLPELVDVADTALNRLGYGTKAAPVAASQLTVNVGGATATITREDLEASRKKIIEAQNVQHASSFPCSDAVVVVPPGPEPGGGKGEES